jgi:PAS domain S-box-containing protein
MQTPDIAGIRQTMISARRSTVRPHDLYHLAFDTSLLPNIISTAGNGNIIMANVAACKLLGYSETEILNRTMRDIFPVRSAYINMVKQRVAQGYAKGRLAVLKKSGKQIPCEITSVVFTGDREKKLITTFVDLSQSILNQKKTDLRVSDANVRLKTRQISEAVANAQELQRAAIGIELHDNINQLLGASKLYLEIGRKNEVNKDFYLRRSAEYIFSAIEEVRKLTRGMIADVISHLGLAEAIANIIKDTMEIYPAKISCNNIFILEEPLNDKFKMNIFRIIQEQLNNILKHAVASVVNISLEQSENDMVLSVSDNGIGFDTAKKTVGIGLANIKSRAKAYHGRAHFDSRPGAGCVMTVTFPLSDAILNTGSLSGESG